MPEVTSSEPGTFCWEELTTTDQNAAKKYYTELFGWKVNDLPVGPDEVYTMLQKKDRVVAALFARKPAERPPNFHPAWLSYIAVSKADDAAKKAKGLGAKIVAEPFDVMDAGRMAVIADPQGAVFAMWEAGRNKGIGLYGDPGSLCWNELATTNAVAAKKFYTSLFGWTEKTTNNPGMTYTEFHKGDQPIGGMYSLTADMPFPPHWLPYFAVDDCDKTESKSTSLGGKTVLPPKDIPDVGRFSYLGDPQGAMFAVIKLLPR